MGWEIGLMFILISALILSGCYFGLKFAKSCFNKFEIGPIILWFKMFSFITWLTFIGMLFLYYFIGD